MVLAYRRWGKVLSAYVDGYAKRINSATGRIHPDLPPLATGTGHFAAWNPNPQNQPCADGDDMASTTSSPRLMDGRCSRSTSRRLSFSHRRVLLPR
jgi:hypothetical protein